MIESLSVIPAQAGSQFFGPFWMPVFAGMAAFSGEADF
jgi:hypothetical protein